MIFEFIAGYLYEQSNSFWYRMIVSVAHRTVFTPVTTGEDTYTLQKIAKPIKWKTILITMSYWRGPYGVYVPNECKVVPEPDGNCNNKNAITEVYYERPILSEEEYHARYCKLINGRWVVVRSPPCSACGFKGYGM